MTWDQVFARHFTALSDDAAQASPAKLCRIINEFLTKYNVPYPRSTPSSLPARVDYLKRHLRNSAASPEQFAAWCEIYYRNLLEIAMPLPADAIVRQLRATGSLTLAELKQRLGREDVAVTLAKLVAIGKVKRIGDSFQLT